MTNVRVALAMAAVVSASGLATPSQGQYLFSPGTDQRVINSYVQAYQAEHPPERFVTTARWPGVQGDPTLLTISYVPDGLSIPAPPGEASGAADSNLFATLDAQFAALGGRARWQGIIAALVTTGTTSAIRDGAVVRWSDFAGVDFSFVRRIDIGGVGDDPKINNWDDGQPFNFPGAQHANAINVTVGAPLTAATLTIGGANGVATTVTIQQVPTAPNVVIDLTLPANDTIGEVVAAINAVAGLSAAVVAPNPAATPAATLQVGTNITVNATTPAGNLKVKPVRGDIRIAMRPLGAGLLAYAEPPADGGNIILNSGVNWAEAVGSTGAFIKLDNSISRAVGNAIGLANVCPNDGTKLMESQLNLAFTGPQHDDIRGAQRLYGDLLEPSDSFGQAATFPAVNPLGPVDSVASGVSIDDPADKDFYVIQFSPPTGSNPLQFQVDVTITPVGQTYPVGPVDAACTGAAFNSAAAIDLAGGIFTTAGVAIGTGAPPATDPFTSLFNIAGPGVEEKFSALIGTPGKYVVVVQGTGTGTESQLYKLTVHYRNLRLEGGLALGPVVSDFHQKTSNSPVDSHIGPTGHGALSFETTDTGEPFFYNNNYTGTRARFGNVEAGFPNDAHTVFAGRSFTEIMWEGVNPAIGGIADHATATTSSAAGRLFGPPPDYFRGVAPTVQLFAADIATGYNPFGGFSVSNESLYFALFGLADPLTNALIGINNPVTVINSSWGANGDPRGDSSLAWAYDVVVNMTGVTAVISAGNSGRIDNTSICDGPGGNLAGGAFVGSRTIGTPATAFNVITVGAVGKGYGGIYEDGGLTPGGGGGRPAGDSGDPVPDRDARENPPSDPTLVPLDTVVDFSSKGPADSFDFKAQPGSVKSNSRPGVHILAAGTGLVKRAIDPTTDPSGPEVCTYEGHKSTTLLLLPSFDPVDNARFAPTSGTSFSAPIVAGAVALLQDYGLAQQPKKSIDSLVMKSILLTSATKLAGWSNSGAPAKPQDNRDGRAFDPADPGALISNEVTGGSGGQTQPLDLAQGAGVLSIPFAFAIYALGDVTDSPLTDPTKPTITKPVEVSSPEFPGVGRPAETTVTQQDAPPSPLQIQRMLDDVRRIDDGLVIMPHRPDFNDPVLTPGGGGKSGAGVGFNPRTPFTGGAGATPPAFGGGGVSPPKPVEIPVINAGNIGWDIGNIGERFIRGFSTSGPGGYVDYLINMSSSLFLDDFFTATLVWNRNITVKPMRFDNPDNPQTGILKDLELENLDLELYDTIDGTVPEGQEPFAFSRTTFNNIEHIHWKIDHGGFMVLRVKWVSQEYDVFKTQPPASVKFALSWATRPYLNRIAAGLPAPPAGNAPELVGFPAMMRVLNAWGREVGTPGYDPLADVNQDGTVNTADLAWVLSHWPPVAQGPSAAE